MKQKLIFLLVGALLACSDELELAESTNVLGTNSSLNLGDENLFGSLSDRCPSRGMTHGSSLEVLYITDVSQFLPFSLSFDNRHLSSNNAGYRFFGNKDPFIMRAGNTYWFQLEAYFSGNLPVVYWSIWIDADLDGRFESEELEVNDYPLSTTNLGPPRIPISAPLDAEIGVTRMRVIASDRRLEGNPCHYDDFIGEVEDHLIEIKVSSFYVPRL